MYFDTWTWVVNPRLDQTRFCLYQFSNGVSRKMRSYSKRTTRGGLWPLQLGNRANDPAHCCRVPSFCFEFVSPLLKTVTCHSGLTFAALLTAHDPTRVRTSSLDVCVKKIWRVDRLYKPPCCLPNAGSLRLAEGARKGPCRVRLVRASCTFREVGRPTDGPMFYRVRGARIGQQRVQHAL